jgi:diguanylate cyclase
MRRMSEGSARHLRAIIQTQTEIAASDLELDAVMELIARRAQDLTRSTGGVIEIADGDEMVYRVTTGEATPFRGVRLKMDASLSGLCVREDKVLRCDDTATDPRVDHGACRQVNARSMICVPLIHGEQTVGVLKVYAPRVNNFDDGDVETAGAAQRADRRPHVARQPLRRRGPRRPPRRADRPAQSPRL